MTLVLSLYIWKSIKSYFYIKTVKTKLLVFFIIIYVLHRLFCTVLKKLKTTCYVNIPKKTTGLKGLPFSKEPLS